MLKQCREELEDKGQEIRDWKNHTGRKRLDRERRKKKSQMSRESWCCIPISTSRNGSVGAGKQENGMSESSNIQSQRILNRSGDVERRVCGVTDSKNQSYWVTFSPDPSLSFGVCRWKEIKDFTKWLPKISKHCCLLLETCKKKKKSNKELGTKIERASSVNVPNQRLKMNDRSFGTLVYIITENKQQHKAGFRTTAQSGGVCGRLPSVHPRPKTKLDLV